jgi:type I restriction enzyme M protein
MPIKKSELYSSLWKSCDELRGSMDASQYKDYVLVLLFMKYVSDKGDRLVDIPEGASFRDMVKLKGQSDIGDRMNKIIGELAKENDLNGIITVADFNDDEKLGKGKDKVDRLSNLIEIFENDALDFSSNRARLASEVKNEEQFEEGDQKQNKKSLTRREREENIF